MLRIVIDDERTFADLEAIYIRNSDYGRRLLELLWKQEIRIDELWLDHDLGEDSEGFKDDIMPIVDWLCEIAWSQGDPLLVDMIYVHSQNPVGAQTSLRVLERYGYRCQRSILPPLKS